MNRKVSVCAGMVAAAVAFSASAEEKVAGQATQEAPGQVAAVDGPGTARTMSASPGVDVAVVDGLDASRLLAASPGVEVAVIDGLDASRLLAASPGVEVAVIDGLDASRLLAASPGVEVAAIDGPDASRLLAAPPLESVAENPAVPRAEARPTPVGITADASVAEQPASTGSALDEPRAEARDTAVAEQPASTGGAVDAPRAEAKATAVAEQPASTSSAVDAPNAETAKSTAVAVADTARGGEVRASEQAASSAETKSESESDAKEVHIPFSFTLVPGLSTSGFHTSNVVNNVSIGLVSTHAKRVDGVAMSLAGNWVEDGGLSGAQLAVGANVSRGPVSGAQFSVATNVSGADLLGLQSTVGVNVVRGHAEGAQLAVGGNITSGAVNGAQLGVGINVAGERLLGAQLAVGANIASGSVHGLQAAAGLNVAGQMSGLQMSSGVSYARSLSGTQLSIINVGGEVDGAQVGIVNVANKIAGAQVGIVNVARESEGEAVGILSIVGGGQAHVAAWTSDVALTHVGVKLGGRHIYSLFTAGYSPSLDGERRRYVLGAGLGAHIPAGRFFFDVDVTSSTLHSQKLFEDTHHVLGQLRLTAGWQVARRFAVFGGVSANTLVSWDGKDQWRELGIGPEWKSVSDEGRTVVRMWPGLLAGVQI
ncbi:LA_2272 family surface repeat-containing protein [Myxococcus sp. Y35]|uniref:LA_2272 family surface repeat-containing protein n=1 Tax=Pseudomyxococcus flavus TaxID=3115648 RepID=UPI003CF2EA6F